MDIHDNTLPNNLPFILLAALHFLSTTSVGLQRLGSPRFRVFTITFILLMESHSPHRVRLYLHTEKVKGKI